jgi:hypothetical protein
MSERVAGLLFKIRADVTSLREGMSKANTAIGGLQGTVKGLGAGLLRMGGITASAALSFETLKQIIKSTEITSDSFEFVVATLKGSLQGLFSTIATGDFGNIVNNMVNAAKATRDFKIAIDELTHAQASAEIKKGILSQRVESARLAAAGTLDPKEKAKYLAEAISFQEQLNDINSQEALKAVKIREDYYKQLMGLDSNYGKLFVENLRKIAANWESFGDTPSELFKGWEQRYNDLVYLMKLSPLTPVQQKELNQLIVALQLTKDYYKLASKLAPEDWTQYAKDIGTYNTVIAEGDKSLRRMTQGLTNAEGEVNKLTEAYGQLAAAMGSAGAPVVTAKTTGGGEGISGGAQAPRGHPPPSGYSGVGFLSPEFMKIWKDNLDEAKKVVLDWNEIILSTVSDTANILADVIENAFAGMNMQQIGQQLLKSVGEFMKKLGAMFLAYGIASSAFAVALKSVGNPVSAAALIAAGAAMIAIGSAISGAATGWGNRMGAGGGVTGGTEMIRGGGHGTLSLSPIRIDITGVQKGRDLYWTNKKYGQYLGNIT